MKRSLLAAALLAATATATLAATDVPLRAAGQWKASYSPRNKNCLMKGQAPSTLGSFMMFSYASGGDIIGWFFKASWKIPGAITVPASVQLDNGQPTTFSTTGGMVDSGGGILSFRIVDANGFLERLARASVMLRRRQRAAVDDQDERQSRGRGSVQQMRRGATGGNAAVRRHVAGKRPAAVRQARKQRQPLSMKQTQTIKRSLLATAAMLLVATTIAIAQEAPDEATKAWALKRAYELNGNSMVGMTSIDLTKERPDPPKAADAVPAARPKRDWRR
jgi:hypothetical protein